MRRRTPAIVGVAFAQHASFPWQVTGTKDSFVTGCRALHVTQRASDKISVHSVSQ
jgi:hypothetical protein